MKKNLICLVAAAAILGSTGAYAAGNSDAKQTRQQLVQKFKKQDVRTISPQAATGSPRAVPEIDVTAGTQAAALVLGTLLLRTERSRRRAQQSSR